MKIKDFTSIPWRIYHLITRKFTWINPDDENDQYTRKESLSMAWSIVGVHSHHWWWVRKYGKLPCGCTRNPLTRRVVLYRWKCPDHMRGFSD